MELLLGLPKIIMVQKKRLEFPIILDIEIEISLKEKES